MRWSVPRRATRRSTASSHLRARADARADLRAGDAGRACARMPQRACGQACTSVGEPTPPCGGDALRMGALELWAGFPFGPPPQY